MKYELKKLKEGLVYKVLVILLLIFTLGLTFFVANNESIITKDSELPIKGFKAIKLSKKFYRENRQEYTVEYLNKALKFYHSMPSGDDRDLETDFKYPDTVFLLEKAYGLGWKPLESLESVKNADDFYSLNKKYYSKIYENNTRYKEIALKKLKSIETPYRTTYISPWRDMWKTMNILNIIVFIISIVIGSKVFSIDNNKGMDKIISSLRKEKKRGIAKNKIYSLLTLISVLYFIPIGLTFLLKIIITGNIGFFDQIQVQYFYSFIPLKFGTATLTYILIGWLSVMTVALVSAWVNLFIKNDKTSFVISMLVTFLPMLLVNVLGSITVVAKYLKVLPIIAINFESQLKNTDIYVLGLSSLSMIVIVGILFVILSVVFLPRLYVNRMGGIVGVSRTKKVDEI